PHTGGLRRLAEPVRRPGERSTDVMTTVAATARGAHGAPAHHDDRSFVRKYIFSTDHKIIGIQFLFLSLFFLLVGGVLAMQIRWQQGFPGGPMPAAGSSRKRWRRAGFCCRNTTSSW